MYNLPADYVQLATAKTRKVSILLRTIKGDISSENTGGVEYRDYYDGDGLISLKIVQGQTSGGFAIGNTICATLTATLTNDVKLIVPGEYKRSSIAVFIRFLDGETPTEWHQLGFFNVDVIKRGIHSQTITAYDAMNLKDKNWISSLKFPAKINDILNNIVAGNTFVLINNATIQTKPIYDLTVDEEEIPYTQRELLGFAASLNGGNICVDGYTGNYHITRPRKTYYTIPYDGIISQTTDEISYTIKAVEWTGSGIQASLDLDYQAGTVTFSNPLDVDNPLTVVNNLNTALKGITYDAITIKKQGTGFFQLGDIVSYRAYDNTMYTMLIQGIVYEISSSGFTETLYSPAKSDYAQSYAGRQATAGGGNIVVESEPENFSSDTVLVGDAMSDDGYCVNIEF